MPDAKQLVSKEILEELADAPIIKCLCGSKYWERVLIIKRVSKEISDTQLVEDPVIICKNCKLELSLNNG